MRALRNLWQHSSLPHVVAPVQEGHRPADRPPLLVLLPAAGVRPGLGATIEAQIQLAPPDCWINGFGWRACWCFVTGRDDGYQCWEAAKASHGLTAPQVLAKERRTGFALDGWQSSACRDGAPAPCFSLQLDTITRSEATFYCIAGLYISHSKDCLWLSTGRGRLLRQTAQLGFAQQQQHRQRGARGGGRSVRAQKWRPCTAPRSRAAGSTGRLQWRLVCARVAR